MHRIMCHISFFFVTCVFCENNPQSAGSGSTGLRDPFSSLPESAVPPGNPAPKSPAFSQNRISDGAGRAPSGMPSFHAFECTWPAPSQPERRRSREYRIPLRSFPNCHIRSTRRCPFPDNRPRWDICHPGRSWQRRRRYTPSGMTRTIQPESNDCRKSRSRRWDRRPFGPACTACS